MRDAYEVRFSKSARRAFTDTLPEKVAAAAFEFIVGALAANPQRVSNQLEPPLHPLYSARRGEYRVIYRIIEAEVLIAIVEMAQHETPLGWASR